MSTLAEHTSIVGGQTGEGVAVAIDAKKLRKLGPRERRVEPTAVSDHLEYARVDTHSAKDHDWSTGGDAAKVLTLKSDGRTLKTPKSNT